MTRPVRCLVTLCVPSGESTEDTAQRVQMIAERLNKAGHAALVDAPEQDRRIGMAIANWWQGDHHVSRGEYSAAAAVYTAVLQDLLRVAIVQFGQERVAEWERLAAACIEGYNREANIINAEQEIKHEHSSVH